MTLEEHFEACDGRPTLNSDDVKLKKVRTRTLGGNMLDYSTRYDIPSLTNTGHIATDYNNIKAIKYPEKD